MKFEKMHEVGDDFIIIDQTRENLLMDPARLAELLTARFHGVGANGMICISDGEGGNPRVTIYGSNGEIMSSESRGLCCAAKWIYENQLTNQTVFDIDCTRPGGEVKSISASLTLNKDKVTQSDVYVGIPASSLADENTALITMEGVHIVKKLDGFNDICMEKAAGELLKQFEALKPMDVTFVVISAQTSKASEISICCFDNEARELRSSVCQAGAAGAAAEIFWGTSEKLTVKAPGGMLKVSLSLETGHLMTGCQAVKVFDGEFTF